MGELVKRPAKTSTKATLVDGFRWVFGFDFGEQAGCNWFFYVQSVLTGLFCLTLAGLAFGGFVQGAWLGLPSAAAFFVTPRALAYATSWMPWYRARRYRD